MSSMHKSRQDETWNKTQLYIRLNKEQKLWKLLQLC